MAEYIEREVAKEYLKRAIFGADQKIDRRIDEMHRRFGVLPDKRCEDCSNLIKGRYHDMILRKCTVYGATHSEASDWRKKYVACGMFCKEWSGTEIIRTLRHSGMPKPPEQPIDGQLDLLKQEATE